MKIDLNNYEAYFLDYLEGNLSPDQVAELLLFLEQHPSLKNEVEDPGLVELEPEVAPSFPHKEALRLPDYSSPITHRNEEDYFIAYREDVLPLSQRAEVEEYLLRFPGRRKDFDTYQKMILKADLQLKYAARHELKRKTTVVTRLYWYAAAAAACLLVAMNLNFDPSAPSAELAMLPLSPEKQMSFSMRKGFAMTAHPLSGVVRPQQGRSEDFRSEVAPEKREQLSLPGEIATKDADQRLPEADKEETASTVASAEDLPAFSQEVETGPALSDGSAMPEEAESVAGHSEEKEYFTAEAFLAGIVKEKVLKSDNPEMSIGKTVSEKLSKAIGGGVDIEKNANGEVLAFEIRIGKFELFRKSGKN